jgi:ATP-dependent DNA helicase DinG
MVDLEEIFSSDGPLAQALPGFARRPSQLAMAHAVADALAARGWLVAEAGTGTGKTFAYLVPALLSGLKVIVSTGTRTLQDQLFHRDLPLLGRALGRPATVALLKGRANYLCRERWLRMPRELPLADGSRELAAVSRWTGITRDGDLAELAELPDGHPLRTALTATRESCKAGRCPEFNRCHVFAARRRAAEADLVVVNHHLLLSDLALKEEGYGDILPSADAVILDEAHQLPELAAQFFGMQFGSRKVDELLADVPTLLAEGGVDPARLEANLEAVRRASQRALCAAQVAAPGGQRCAWSDDLTDFDGAARALVSALCDLADALRALGGGEDLEHGAVRAGSIAGELDAVLEASPAEGARLLQAGARGFNCQVLPFDVAPKMRAIMESRPAAWIFTSATLAVAGDFSHFVARMGLAGRCDTLAIDSPFDYGEQALLFLPQGLPDPNTPAHPPAALELAAQLTEMSGGGAFLLFTSHRGLQHAAQRLRQRWGSGADARFTLLVQGEAPREQLLREFREHGDAVLLGTASFWEGVDVPGWALRLVTIDRLPFGSPEDPVLQARAQHVRGQGGNPFNDFQVPEAAIALKQGVGRLIRSERDSGVVAILDPRITARGYGRKLLAALPPMRRTHELSEVRDMLERCAV